MKCRLRSLLMLIGPTTRRVRWGTAAACFILAGALTWVVASRGTAAMGHVVSVLRWAVVLLTAGVASVLDDPTEGDLAGAGVPVGCRRLVGLVVVGVPTVIGWAVLVTVPDVPLPWMALSVEAAALTLLGVAVASTRPTRSASVPAGIVAVVVPSLLLVAASFLPARWALVADPADVAGWRDAHNRWALLAAAATVATAVTARDPSRRAAWRVVRPARPRPCSSVMPSTASSESLMETS